MKRLGLVILLVAMLAVSFGLTAQLTAPRPMTEADRATFARANQLVEAGQVAAAVNLYEQLSAQGIVNADLFYNLGQAYSQLGKTNQAVEYYTRAAQTRAARWADRRTAQAGGRLHPIGGAAHDRMNSCSARCCWRV